MIFHLHESKTSRSSCLIVLHYYAVNNFSISTEITLQAFRLSVPAQAFNLQWTKQKNPYNFLRVLLGRNREGRRIKNKDNKLYLVFFLFGILDCSQNILGYIQVTFFIRRHLKKKLHLYLRI